MKKYITVEEAKMMNTKNGNKVGDLYYHARYRYCGSTGKVAILKETRSQYVVCWFKNGEIRADRIIQNLDHSGKVGTWRVGKDRVELCA